MQKENNADLPKINSFFSFPFIKVSLSYSQLGKAFF